MYNYRNLTQRVRRYMTEEVRYDIDRKSLHLSEKLNAKGKDNYANLLLSAVENDSDAKFANDLEKYISDFYAAKSKGLFGRSHAKQPSAAQTLAETEFNRYYIRALCRLAIELGSCKLQIYRAKESSVRTSETERLVGQIVNPILILRNLRENKEPDAALGLASGTPAGLSVELVDI